MKEAHLLAEMIEHPRQKIILRRMIEDPVRGWRKLGEKIIPMAG